MANFVAVAGLDQLAQGHGMTVTVRGLPVALFNIYRPGKARTGAITRGLLLQPLWVE